MPELPEVETIRRDLTRVLRGAKVSDVKIMFAPAASHSAAFFKRRLKNAALKDIQRRGKLLIFVFLTLAGRAKKSGGDVAPIYMIVHLKMTGQLIYQKGGQSLAGGHSLAPVRTSQAVKLNPAEALALTVGGDLPNRHTRVVITFLGGGRLYFNDLRKFGYVKIVQEDDLQALLVRNYGPEPLSPSFLAANLAAVLARKRISIKAALLDQKIVAGLGNIYVDEVLWSARVRPNRPANSLSSREVKVLHGFIQAIIKEAIKYRGTTFSDYRDGSGRRGNFSKRLKVYGRGGRPCAKCGEEIRKIKLAGRGTHYCPRCQF